MTGPATLCEAAQRVMARAPQNTAIAEFLDSFYSEPSAARRLAMLEPEPPLSDDKRLDALLGAIGEYLAKQYQLPHVPHWAGDERRALQEPWHTTESDSDAMREYLTFTSPTEFARHNIFTEALPLRRARRPLIT